MRALRRLLAFVFKLIMAALAVLLILFVTLCVLVDRYGSVERLAPADAIVILGARVLPDGQPGPDLTPRIEHGVWLYQQGYAINLICAGGAAGDAMSAAAIARREAIQRGVPADAVLLADGTSNTREDAARTAEVMAQRGWRSALVVSHPLHMLRATLLFRLAGVEAYASPTTTRLDAIPARWRIFYAAREAALLVVDALTPAGPLPTWLQRVQRWLQRAGLDDVA
jgi:uncharacterized SAM-binding protein YcdF (DUF218 family)